MKTTARGKRIVNDVKNVTKGEKMTKDTKRVRQGTAGFGPLEITHARTHTDIHTNTYTHTHIRTNTYTNIRARTPASPQRT